MRYPGRLATARFMQAGGPSDPEDRDFDYRINPYDELFVIS
jgi:hypothetical protein